MQYKGIFLSVFISLVGFGSNAQTNTSGIVMPTPAKTIRKDTVVKTVQSNRAIASKSSTARFAGVPLAGQNTYYGKMTEFVNGFTRTYLGAHNKTLSVVQGRSNKRFSMMENVLIKHNVPKELKYLSVIESALNNKAVSGAGAVGPWQLMDGTARNMGLTVNGNRDDRTDWFKSTNAAAKYLRTLYGQLNDWLLVVAAYNSGPVPVQRAIERTGSHNFWDIKKYLPRETQGHVLAFVATASIFEKMSKYIAPGRLPDDFKFGNEEVPLASKAIVAPPKPQFTEEELNNMAIVRISEPVSLDYMAQELGIDKKILKKWNLDYDLFVYNAYTEDYYGLRIPKDKLDSFIEKKDQLTRKSRQIFSEEASL
jgi:membrane-bound lytic murein transglycosylase D